MPDPPGKVCPICRGATLPYDPRPAGVTAISCGNCGKYYTSFEVITEGLRDSGPGILSLEQRAHIAGWIRDRWHRGEKNITVLTHDIEPILRDVRRLSPAEKTSHLLATLARVSRRPGAELGLNDIRYTDALAVDPAELGVYLNWLADQQFITHVPGSNRIRLTLPGWTEVARLERQRAVNATLAFMAMPFGDTKLDNVVTNCFVPAAKAAGYELRKLTEGQPAGLIDDQLRVRLRTARFVVADLTSGNQGAYWEAGFAEGLGTPVIYSCERSVFTDPDRKKGTHFDTNHLVTVLWDDRNLTAAAEELKAHIRATLPTEAKLED